MTTTDIDYIVNTIHNYNHNGSRNAVDTIRIEPVRSGHSQVSGPVFAEATDGLSRAAMSRLVNSGDPVVRRMVAQQPNITTEQVKKLTVDDDFTTVLMLGTNPAVDRMIYTRGVSANEALNDRLDTLVEDLGSVDDRQFQVAVLSKEHLLVQDLVLTMLDNAEDELLALMSVEHRNVLVRDFAQLALDMRGVAVVVMA